jgi:hypothetical protein
MSSGNKELQKEIYCRISHTNLPFIYSSSAERKKCLDSLYVKLYVFKMTSLKGVKISWK